MATDINHVVLVGRLTRDAELKYTAGGQAVCKFSIAVNRNKKSGDQWVDEANFFDITLWGRQGEAVNQYLIKGKQVGIDGELRQDRWEQDGQKRSKVEIVANNLQLLGGGSSGGGGYQERRGDADGGRVPREGPPASDQRSSGGDDGFADDIPF
ncbi:single-stranded DNA-binding protein [Spirochaetia bacterium]|nr:single-stranded DNA-binding protein [Spirochaetia bacterium]